MPAIAAYIYRWAATAAMLCGASLAAAGQLPQGLGEKLARDYIAPAMSQFQRSAERLQSDLQAWCAEPTQAGASATQGDFAELVRAWSGIEFLRFGPLVAANRYERIYFWPDSRGVTLRQVQGLLGGEQAIPSAAGLATQSVALQGLPALEYVLYGKDGLLAPAQVEARTAGAAEGIDKGRMRACAYAVAIAGNLSIVGSELEKEWAPDGDYARQFAAPSPANALYRSRQEVAGEAIKALSTGLQFARDVKLMPMLGANMKAARHSKAPFWRSGLSTQAMAASVQGMLRFYIAGAYEYAEGEAWMDSSIRHELEQAQAGLRAMRSGPEDLLKSEEGYRGLTLAGLILKNVKGVVDEHMAPAFGVRIGFNALDGD
ncbi:MAG: imelysin family protein [Burkholderiaceae bacterium]